MGRVRRAKSKVAEINYVEIADLNFNSENPFASQVVSFKTAFPKSSFSKK